MEEVTRVRGVLQHPQDHLLREDSCCFDLPGLEGCGTRCGLVSAHLHEDGGDGAGGEDG